MNKIEDSEVKKVHFITLGGPVVYSQLKLLYPAGNFDEVSYDDWIRKLCDRLDKTESDMIQRLRFNTLNQNPDESLKDYALSLRLQAQFYGFGDHKDVAILDRIVAGVKDNELRKRLLREEKLSLATAEKILETWEMATTNSRPFAENSTGTGTGEVFSLNNAPSRGRGRGTALSRLGEVYRRARQYGEEENRNNDRGSVKRHLGYKPRFNNRTGNRSNSKPYQWGREMERPKIDQRICDFCGFREHTKRKCFQYKKFQNHAINSIEGVPGNRPAEQDEYRG